MCGLVPADQHDCLKALLEHTTSTAAIMDKLCLEMDDAEIQGRNMRSQIDNFTKILKSLRLVRTF